jgi:CHAT domain
MSPQHQADIAARVIRVLEGSHAAQAAGDVKALSQLRDEGTQLMLELAPLLEAGRDLRAAEMLLEVAYLNIQYQLASRNWLLATGACTLLSGAVATITTGITYNEYTDPQRRLLDLMARMRNVAEVAACAAHQSGQLMNVLMCLEVQTGLLFDMLMSKTSGRAVQRRTAGPFEQFYFTPRYAHAIRAARITGRTILYVVPGFSKYDGVAIRVSADDATGDLVESTWLPGLRAEALDAQLEQVRAAFRRSGSPQELSARVQQLLDWTGRHAWEAIAERWPDVVSRPLAVVPVSRAALLPLYTATFRGEPACTVLDMTMAPSARALHFAALGDTVPAAPDAYVAADAWHGDLTLGSVHAEATAVASVYGTEPVLYSTDEAAASSPNPSTAGRLRTATVAHLACHATLDGTDLAILLGGVVSLNQLLAVDDNMLPGRPVVVLSACDLGGIAGENISAEQYGFPAGLLAIGARSVVGALWPVPDAWATIRVMKSFHRHLAAFPSHGALPAVITQARRAQISPLIWGSLVHFGA